MLNHQSIITDLIRICRTTGDLLLNFYNSNDIKITYKEDSSPVTCADFAANKLIHEEISKLTPNIPIISEEDVESHKLQHSSPLFWSIDPLDATSSFINRNGEFTINIGLIKNNTPDLGLIYAPLSNNLYFNINDKAFICDDSNSSRQIKTRTPPEEGATLLVSTGTVNQTKLKTFFSEINIKEVIPFSSALKICRIAEGLADFYPRFGKTMEWDTAAAHAILNAAGGSIKDLEGSQLRYGKINNNYYNPDFIASGK